MIRPDGASRDRNLVLARLAGALGVVSRLALWTAAVGLVLMTGVVAWQVFARYVLNASPSWTEPASLLLMSWFILLGAAVGVRESDHLGFEVGLHYAPPPIRRAMLLVTELVVIGIGLCMAWYGAELAAGTWSANMAGLAIPQGVDYLPLAFGGALIALFALEKLVRLLALDEEVALVRPDEPNMVRVED